jgi:hypothetical protein
MRKLLREARALTRWNDLHAASRRLEVLKWRWKMLRSANPGEEQRLRERFEAACDEVSRNCAKQRTGAEVP